MTIVSWNFSIAGGGGFGFGWDLAGGAFVVVRAVSGARAVLPAPGAGAGRSVPGRGSALTTEGEGTVRVPDGALVADGALVPDVLASGEPAVVPDPVDPSDGERIWRTSSPHEVSSSSAAAIGTATRNSVIGIPQSTDRPVVLRWTADHASSIQHVHRHCHKITQVDDGPLDACCGDGQFCVMASPKSAFDVFVSYRRIEPDRSWVRNRLVPALREGNLNVCVDFENFRLGEPLVTEMGRAVETSEHTLAVLTPAYLESAFTDLESILAEHLGLEQARQRLIVVLREAVTPRLSIRARLWLDMSNDEEFQSGVATLCRELKATSSSQDPLGQGED
jgi:hypothetical protein